MKINGESIHYSNFYLFAIYNTTTNEYIGGENGLIQMAKLYKSVTQAEKRIESLTIGNPTNQYVIVQILCSPTSIIKE